MQQCRHKERAPGSVGVDNIKVVSAAIDDIRLVRKLIDAVSYLVALPLAGQGAHVDVLARRVADPDFAQ